MKNLDSLLKSKDLTLLTRIHIVKVMIFPIVMYRCESWTIKKAERQRIDAFELWCWRRLLRVPWTARRSNQSILKEINPKYSMEGLVLQLQYLVTWCKEPTHWKRWWCWERLRAGREGGNRDETVGWYHRPSGHKFEQTLGDSVGGFPFPHTLSSIFKFVQFSHSVVSDSLRPHGLQHARLPCFSPTPGACSNSCPSSQWCHPTISSSVLLFSSCLQSFPASGSFPLSQFFAQVAKVLELQLQHQSFQWIFRNDFL